MQPPPVCRISASGRTTLVEFTVGRPHAVGQWASEAESGFEGLQVELFGGRAWDEVATEPLEPRTIRVSATMWRLIEQDASRQGVSVSAWTRQALTREVTQTLKAS